MAVLMHTVEAAAKRAVQPFAERYQTGTFLRQFLLGDFTRSTEADDPGDVQRPWAEPLLLPPPRTNSG